MLPTTTTRFRVPLRHPQAVTETSAVLWLPDRGRRPVGVVLGHGAGTDMTNPVIRAAGRGLSALGFPVAAFNFAYVEAGRKAPDPVGRLEFCYRDVVHAVRDRLDGSPLVLGGRSMGGRIATHLVAQGEPAGGLVLLGYPLHPAAAAGVRPPSERLRTAHWQDLRVPLLFVQGDRDRLCALDVLSEELRKLPVGTDARLHVVAGGDHGFKVRKSDGRSESSVLEEVVTVLGEWLNALPVPAQRS